MSQEWTLSKHQGKHQHYPFCLAPGTSSYAAFSLVQAGALPTSALLPAFGKGLLLLMVMSPVSKLSYPL